MVEVIAEIGLNHNGSLDRAKKLIDAAKTAGADTAKFQASHPEAEISRRYEQAQFDMISELILAMDELAVCKAHCEQVGMRFLCTPADVRSIDALVAMGVDRLKIGSDNLTNAEFLYHAEETLLPLIVSTGMANDAEIAAACELVGYYQLTLLHCTSAYPCDVKDANLAAIPSMIAQWPALIGWSDHTTSLTLPAVAVGLGAVIIEKHITLSRSDDGPDHDASLTPEMFEEMVRRIRETEAAMGDGEKRMMDCEIQTAYRMRKSLIAAEPIRAGETFTRANLTAKRPGWGHSAMDYHARLGTVAMRDYDADEMVD